MVSPRAYEPREPARRQLIRAAGTLGAGHALGAGGSAAAQSAQSAQAPQPVTHGGRISADEIPQRPLGSTGAVGRAPDVLASDPTRRRLYMVSSGSRTPSVLTEQFGAGGGTLHHSRDVYMPHAHPVAVDPPTHLVSFPLENIDGKLLVRKMAGESSTDAH